MVKYCNYLSETDRMSAPSCGPANCGDKARARSKSALFTEDLAASIDTDLGGGEGM